jgi:GDP/UDP-N,N'-diacetylbacillosamine 2-epimerase (hydrolysing)
LRWVIEGVQQAPELELQIIVTGMHLSPEFGLTYREIEKEGTINIGDLQRGRLQAGSVINCEPNRQSIAATLKKLYTAGFRANLSQVNNPYGEGGASEMVVETIKYYEVDGIAKKSFYDLPAHLPEEQ